MSYHCSRGCDVAGSAVCAPRSCLGPLGHSSYNASGATVMKTLRVGASCWVSAVLFVGTFSTLSPTAAPAASMLYGDMMGTDIQFLAVTESSDHPLPLYGPPNLIAPPAPIFPCVLANNCTVNGNSLTFSPQQFDAISVGQSPLSETTDGQLTFMAVAKANKSINLVNFSEGGALTVSGLTGTTNDTQVDVSLVGFVNVVEIDGVGVNPVAIPVVGIFDFGVGGSGTW